jgi:hypothetical protein
LQKRSIKQPKTLLPKNYLKFSNFSISMAGKTSVIISIGLTLNQLILTLTQLLMRKKDSTFVKKSKRTKP